MRATILGLVTAGALTVPWAAVAQEPGAAQGMPDSMRQLLERETEPQPGDYTYSAGGRRDPFVSLLKPVEGTVKTNRPVGMEGFLIQEVALKGIVKTKEGYISMIVGPDSKAYFCTVGQRLFDGGITAMDQTSVTFRQEVTDPLSPVKVRDIRKSLYPSEEVRQ
jgi:Tfp pilus assembly protein PilP